MEILESGVGELIQPFDLDEFREWNRTKKSRKLDDKLMSEQEAVSRFVYDGCYIVTHERLSRLASTPEEIAETGDTGRNQEKR